MYRYIRQIENNMLTVLVSSSIDQGPNELKIWFRQPGVSELKVTKLHFYFHDLRGITSVTVASANSTASSPTLFGSSSIMDDPLTEGPEFSSNQREDCKAYKPRSRWSSV